MMLIFYIVHTWIPSARPSLRQPSDDWKLHVGWSLESRVFDWDKSGQQITFMVEWIGTNMGDSAEAGKEGLYVLLAW